MIPITYKSEKFIAVILLNFFFRFYVLMLQSRIPKSKKIKFGKNSEQFHKNPEKYGRFQPLPNAEAWQI